MAKNSYAMYTDDGDRAVQKMFDDLKARLQDDVTYLGQCHDELTANEEGYTDTAVRESVGYALAELLFEAIEFFGEGLKIEGEAFRKFFIKHCMEKIGINEAPPGTVWRERKKD